MMRSKISGSALLALGAGLAFWLLRDPRARRQAQRLMSAARAQLGGAPARPLPAAQLAGFNDGQFVSDLEHENLTITQRVRSNLGREPALAGLPHLNVNTEGQGVVYLRGYTHTDEQRQIAERNAAETEGVKYVINELSLDQADNL